LKMYTEYICQGFPMAQGKTVSAIWTVRDARQNFSEMLTGAARGEPQKIIRRGKEAFVLVSEKAWMGREASREPQHTLGTSSDAFLKHLLSFPGDWQDDFGWVREADRMSSPPVPDFAEEDRGT
jgi:prevent-host-death family protein